MLRLWKESYAKTGAVSQSAVVSVIAHAALILAAVTGTQKAAGVPEDSIANRKYDLPQYNPPPDRTPGQEGSRETLRYIEFAPEGFGAGLGTPKLDPKKSFTPTDTSTPGDLGTELQSSPNAPTIPKADSVLSILEVDSAATRDPASAAPAYPLSLLKQNVQGSVYTQYVVDTNGFADTTSLKIVRSTHPEFTASVRAALPYMRFSAARLAGRKVRQLVEQEFSFKIQQSSAVTDTTHKPVRPLP
jgi:outer membrane biosynthesis protein TonB